MDVIGVLYVEENTQEAEKAIELMNLSGLAYQVFVLTREEADERRRDCDQVPMLMSPQAICKGLEAVEWYSRCYGKGGPQHKANCQVAV